MILFNIKIIVKYKEAVLQVRTAFLLLKNKNKVKIDKYLLINNKIYDILYLQIRIRLKDHQFF